MRRPRVDRLVILVAAVAFFAAACTPTSDSNTDQGVVEVFGPFRGEDAAKFAATVAPFEEETGIDVRYIGAGSFVQNIQQRVADADYPDVALFPQPALLRDMAAQGALVPVPDEVASRFVADVPGAVIGEAGGVLYGIWFRAAAKSLVWYRPDVFEARGYTVPKTWDELVALSQVMKSDGVAPWCLSMESFGATGWVGTDWIEDIVLREQGVDVFDGWVAGDVLFSSSEITQAFATFGAIVNDAGSVFGGTNRILNVPWQRAADPMFDPEPACMMQKQASFWVPDASLGAVFGENFDFFILPGVTAAPAPVLVSGDIAGAFNDRPEVAAFMEFLAGPDAGVGWASKGGFISPHPEFDPADYIFDVDRKVGQTILDAPSLRFDGSDLMPSVVGTDAFWEGIRDFIRTGIFPAAEIDEAFPRPALFNDG